MKRCDVPTVSCQHRGHVEELPELEEIPELEEENAPVPEAPEPSGARLLHRHPSETIKHFTTQIDRFQEQKYR